MTQIVTSLRDVLAYYGGHSVIGAKARLWAVVMNEVIEGHTTEDRLQHARNDCLNHAAIMFGADVSKAMTAPLIDKQGLAEFWDSLEPRDYDSLLAKAIEADYVDRRYLPKLAMEAARARVPA